MNTVYNFSAGPAVLPAAVLHTAQQEMLDYNGTGIPVMSMSHRSAEFQSILYHAEQDLRLLLNVPDHYKILFLQGGGECAIQSGGNELLPRLQTDRFGGYRELVANRAPADGKIHSGGNPFGCARRYAI